MKKIIAIAVVLFLGVILAWGSMSYLFMERLNAFNNCPVCHEALTTQSLSQIYAGKIITGEGLQDLIREMQEKDFEEKTFVCVVNNGVKEARYICEMPVSGIDDEKSENYIEPRTLYIAEEVKQGELIFSVYKDNR